MVALELASMCEAFNCLPDKGGLFDQDNIVMRRLKIVKEAQAERFRKDNPPVKPTKASPRASRR